ncbi:MULTISPECIES: hypothetical protein [Haloarcula]|uniref:hypothetical protein n=1 Tax=Haloarcula TaxID=2237 RepID=UPI0023EAD6E4|nr:hypothetical protein [Halomicroarcula sp. XH51]
MNLVSVITEAITGLVVLLVSVQAGYSTHETIHYRATRRWTNTQRLKFRFITPTFTNFDPSKVPNKGIQLSAIAPTLLFVPVLIFLLITVGLPPLLNMELQDYAHLGFFLTLTLAAWPSRGDIRALINPEQ